MILHQAERPAPSAVYRAEAVRRRGASVACALSLLGVWSAYAQTPDAASALFTGAAHVKAELVSENTSIRPGSSFWAAVRLEIKPGWHVYGSSPGDSGLPTTVEWRLPPGFSAGPLLWPPTSPFSFAGEKTYGYEGEVILPARIDVSPAAAVGSAASLRAEVGWLACRQGCVPGKASLSLTLPVSEGKPEEDPRWAQRFSEARGRRAAVVPADAGAPLGFFLAVLFAFLGGLILNLMPCVLPVLSLKVMGFVREAHSSPRGPSAVLLGRQSREARREPRAEEGNRTALAHGLSFTAGVVVSFWILLGILLLLRAAGRLLGWGFQFQDPSVVAAMAVFMFILGLNLFGVFEVGARAASVGSGLQGRGGLAGSFFTGFLATIVATPCTAPFMGSAIGYALAVPAPAAFAVFTALALGMAAPSLTLSASPKLLARVPKAGRWTETLRQAMGFLMMGTVAWLAGVLAGLSGSRALPVLLAAFVAAAMGAWIYGRWGSLDRGRVSRVVAAILALALAVGGITVSARAAREAAAAPTTARPNAPPAGSPETERWQSFSGERLTELRAAGKPVFIQFGAAWCLTCAVNEKTSLGNAAVRRRLDELGVAVLKADWTDGNEEVTRALAGYGRNGVPLYVLYGPGAAQPAMLPEVLTPGIVLAALERLR